MRKTEEKMEFENLELEPEQETLLGIVIEPGIKDCSGQVLSREEISEAMSIYNAFFGNVLLQHRDSRGYLPNFDDIANIQTLENWQHTFNPDKIKIINSFVTDAQVVEGQSIAPGSWLMELSINDPEIRKAVDNGYLRGLSYGGAGCLFPVNSHIQVVDLLAAEISLVDFPCNKRQWLRKKYPNEFSCRLPGGDPDNFQKDSFRRMSRESSGKRLDVIIAKRPGKETTEEQAYRYPLEAGWTKDSAESHCQKHQGSFEDIKREEK